jgi:hypothetical protein
MPHTGTFASLLEAICCLELVVSFLGCNYRKYRANVVRF